MTFSVDGTLRNWLRRVPTPVALRLDGKQKVLIGSNPHTRWKDVQAVIEQAEPELIEALDPENNVLRVKVITREDDTPDDSQAAAAARMRDENRDVQMANIILEAGDRGARRHGEAYALAFEKMYGLVELLSQRLGGLEQAWQETLNQRAEDLVARAAENPDGADANLIGKVLELAAMREERKTSKK
jgi:hypothetical protein